MSNETELSNAIKRKALELGFDLCGIAQVRPLKEHTARLDTWLEKGFNAGMGYMERNRGLRTDPSTLVENAKSVIICGLNYYQEYIRKKDSPGFSLYALGDDYHALVKDRLYLLLGFIKEQRPPASGRVFVDSAPVLERAWAVEAGLGHIGKNSMLINKESGSYFFIGEIIINAELDYDNADAEDICGSCTRCIDACPNGAIMDNRTIDSRKCISYLTIEHKGPVDEYGPANLNNSIFGCDVCQDVCPWNSNIRQTEVTEFRALPEIVEYTFEDWKKITEEDFKIVFRKSPVSRSGYSNFMRNLDVLSNKDKDAR